MGDEPEAHGLKHWAMVAILVLSGVLALAGVYGDTTSTFGALVVTIAIVEFLRRRPGRGDRPKRDDGAESLGPQAGWKPSQPTDDPAKKVQRYKLLGVVAIVILCGILATTDVLGEHGPIIIALIVTVTVVAFFRRRP